jgi:SAM-dependent methyltransferase
VAKCISIGGHDRAVPEPRTDPVERWAEQLDGWAIPPEILAGAPEPPWGFEPSEFAVDDGGPVETASSAVEREVLPPGGSVLDVGSGGGRGSLVLAPPAVVIHAVDESAAMLDLFEQTAEGRGITVVTHRGRWPDIADAVPPADVVICHHVVYNVPDIVPFLVALTGHARLAVVVELTSSHPMTGWRDVWRRFWDLDRPMGPTADEFVTIVRQLGWSPEVWRRQRSLDDLPFLDPERAVRSTRRRLCLPLERTDEVAEYLRDHPLRWPSEVVTVRWPGPERH